MEHISSKQIVVGERVVGEMTYVHAKGWGIIGDDVYWHISNVTAKLQQVSFSWGLVSFLFGEREKEERERREKRERERRGERKEKKEGGREREKGRGERDENVSVFLSLS